ncbi:signal peptidase II [Streptomyces sp. N2-109]|uniref:Lipoprotein signal peptidase n=1 Tax=Streptomyces gossypii TaxID=2883101 RepID=A0ABT2JZS2_9ACTN|nr:signal peptidase II [Streptomyces gossypii]MCT2593393.1 signal peptidase II [Streptomyces gossypii]
MTEAERAIGTPNEQTPEQSPEGQKPGAHEDEAAAETESGAEAAEERAEEPPSRGSRRIPLLLGIAAFAYVLDLITKLIVVAELEPDHTVIEVFGTVLQFEVVRNKGAAFGMGEALTILLTGIATVVIVVIARLARKLYSTPWAIALGMLLGGAFGNLTDRIFRSPGVFQGAVVDFIAPTHFAVFNLADSAIVSGGILIVILSFRGLDPDGTVHRD